MSIISSHTVSHLQLSRCLLCSRSSPRRMMFNFIINLKMMSCCWNALYNVFCTLHCAATFSLSCASFCAKKASRLAAHFMMDDSGWLK